MNLMIAFLVSVLLSQANPTGVVTGVVRNSTGTPAAGIRVYAMTVPESKDERNAGTVMESLTQTDESGLYRLEIPAGRYYIGAGSVTAPTYFPGTSDVGLARVISIAPAAVIEGIDFSGFVPPSSPAAPARIYFQPYRPDATGVLSGVIRHPDGTPAAGIPVSAAPVSVVNGTPLPGPAQGTMTRQIVVGGRTVQVLGSMSGYAFVLASRVIHTDSAGRYRITNLAPDTYYIAAGYADSPTLYPGVTNAAAATTVTTTAAINLNALDFTLTPSRGVTVRGVVSLAGGVPADGATIDFRMNPQAQTNLFLPTRPFQIAVSKPDGSFEFTGVVPGTYTVEAKLSGASPIVNNITVGDQTVENLHFEFPVSARIP